MNYGLLFRTLRHLKPTQVLYQVKKRLVKPAYRSLESPFIPGVALKTDPVPKFPSCRGSVFSFLNLEHEFSGWDYTGNGMLWAYNQNYFDWINQSGFSEAEGCKWIDAFITDLSGNKVGLDPYPIALRSMNWVKFFCRYPKAATRERLDSLYSQLRLLERKLEYHLLGNHLLEDAYALFIGACYFNDASLKAKAIRLLEGQLKEQILPDGAHYEQSPMYHCILLDRLLDCINIANGEVGGKLEIVAARMLGHLESIVWADGSIPLLNDSANGVAPVPAQLYDYARRLGLTWDAVSLRECGYRRLVSKRLEVCVDVGDITATYQPGHTHADTFNYELRIDGKPFIVDTGISTYNKNERRQLERSTKAHNTVSVDGKDSTEVWGGFRVGRRACVRNFRCLDEDGKKVVKASHNGFVRPCYRQFELCNDIFAVVDRYEGDATSFIHLAEGADETRISLEGAERIIIKPWRYSTEYNRFSDGKVLEVHFNGTLRYVIQ